MLIDYTIMKNRDFPTEAFLMREDDGGELFIVARAKTYETYSENAAGLVRMHKDNTATGRIKVTDNEV